MIGHSSLLISMDRVHHLLHPPPAGVPPDGLRYIELLTGDMLAGAVGDVGVAADFRSASCFAFGAYDLTSQQETFFTALLKLATRDDPSIEDGSPAEQAQQLIAMDGYLIPDSLLFHVSDPITHTYTSSLSHPNSPL